MRIRFILRDSTPIRKEMKMSVISCRIGRVFTGNNLFLLRVQWTKAKTKYNLTELADRFTAGHKYSGRGLGVSFPINVLFCLLRTK